MHGVNKRTVSSNFLWRLLERFGAQGVTFIVSIVLARILDPSVYGSVALVTVITSILQVFVDSGMGSALVQKKNADHLDFSTVFFFNMAVCISLYVLLFLFAPFIAYFYDMNNLTPVIRALGCIVIISGFKNIQQAYVSRTLQFKKFFFATLGGTIGAAFVGIYMAIKGYGVWALVAQYLFNGTVDTIILWITVKWRPKIEFSFERLKGLFSFGSKLLASSLLNTLWLQLRALIIGKKYTPEDLAFYNKGNYFPNIATTAITSSIDSVLLPVMSKQQSNINEVKQITRRAIKVGSFILWPIMMGLAACSEPMIKLLLTNKWLPAVPFLQVFCISYAFLPLHAANLNAIKAVGRSDITLRLEMLKASANCIIILIVMWISPFAMALGALLASIVCQVINAWPNKKLINYSYLEQIIDILPAISLSVVMGAIVFTINLINIGPLITLLIQIPLGVFVYIIGAKICKMDTFDYCLELVKSLFHH